MPSLHYRYTLILISALAVPAVSCKKDLKLEENDQPPKVTLVENQKLLTGNVVTPMGVQKEGLRVFTNAGDYPITKNGAFNAALYEFPTTVAFVEDRNGVVLFAGVIREGNFELNVETTTRSLLELMPVMGMIEESARKGAVDELTKSPRYAALLLSVEAAIKAGKSPMAEDDVAIRLNELLSQTILPVSPTAHRPIMGVKDVPEVDYLVEPRIEYQESKLVISNDGLTSATWGISVSVDGEPIGEPIGLRGNLVRGSSLLDIVDWINSGDPSIIKKSPPVEIAVAPDKKYQLHFGAPFTIGQNRSSASNTAFGYLIWDGFSMIFNGFGLPLKSDAYKCLKELLDNLSGSLLLAVEGRGAPADESFFANYLFSQFGKYGIDITGCALDYTEKKGEFAHYFKRITRFLDIYAKLHTAFAFGKLVGDSYLLNDIQICRQVTQGDLFPCYTLVKDPALESRMITANQQVEVSVRLQTDFPIADNSVFPQGVTVNWTVKEGGGRFVQSTSTADQIGIARASFVPGSASQQSVAASVLKKDGGVLQEVIYKFSVVEEIPFDYEVVFVEGGTFDYGFQPGLEYNRNVYPGFSLSSFSIGKFEVTEEQWKNVMGYLPKEGQAYYKYCPKCAVENVSWDEVQVFIRKLGGKYRLPTGAEWEYAAKGGNKSKGYAYSGSNNLYDVAWVVGSYPPEEVGGKAPNELGIYDMAGGVMEWCSDKYVDDYYWKQGVPPKDWGGPTFGGERTARLTRGGYDGVRNPIIINDLNTTHMVTHLYNLRPDSRFGGFRLVSVHW